MTRDAETRAIRDRGKIIQRQTDLSEAEALTIAWKEQGYSASEIAKRIGSTKGTVDKRLDRAVAQYGLEAAWPTAEERTLTEVIPEDLWGHSHGVQQQWIDVAADYPRVHSR